MTADIPMTDSLPPSPETPAATPIIHEVAWLIENRNRTCDCGHGLPWHDGFGATPLGKGRCSIFPDDDACLCTGYAPTGPICWWDGNGFVPDHSRAVHFARKQDADRIIEIHKQTSMTWAVATEHMWAAASHPSGAPPIIQHKFSSCVSDGRCLCGEKADAAIHIGSGASPAPTAPSHPCEHCDGCVRRMRMADGLHGAEATVAALSAENARLRARIEGRSQFVPGAL